MKNRSPKQFELLANCFERIRDHEVMIESSWRNSKPLAYFTHSKTSVSSRTSKRYIESQVECPSFAKQFAAFLIFICKRMSG